MISIECCLSGFKIKGQAHRAELMPWQGKLCAQCIGVVHLFAALWPRKQTVPIYTVLFRTLEPGLTQTFSPSQLQFLILVLWICPWNATKRLHGPPESLFALSSPSYPLRVGVRGSKMSLSHCTIKGNTPTKFRPDTSRDHGSRSPLGPVL